MSLEITTEQPAASYAKPEKNGHDLLLDIDVQGAEQIKRKLPDAISIFVLPPDRKTLEWRLRKRSEDSEKVIQRRLVTATSEIENYDKYNYILVNDSLEDSIESFASDLAFGTFAPRGASALRGGRKDRGAGGGLPTGEHAGSE